jgi:hypothetical protein
MGARQVHRKSCNHAKIFSFGLKIPLMFKTIPPLGVLKLITFTFAVRFEISNDFLEWRLIL